MRYPLDEHRRAMGRWTRDPLICTCTPENPRHVHPWHCVTIGQIATWKLREQPPKALARDAEQRATWLWLWFSQDPEARRLSGRPEALAPEAPER